MPVSEISKATALALRDQEGTHFVVFLASGTPSWCPDCREAKPHLEAVFGESNAPVLNIVYLGTREEWKDRGNEWRTGPFKVDQTPLLVKLINGVEKQRLGEAACQSEHELRAVL